MSATVNMLTESAIINQVLPINQRKHKRASLYAMILVSMIPRRRVGQNPLATSLQ